MYLNTPLQTYIFKSATPLPPLLPNIREQIITSPKPALLPATLCLTLLRWLLTTRRRRRCRTTPPPKVIILRYLRGTPPGTLRLRMRRRSGGLTGCAGRPYVVGAPGVHVAEAGVGAVVYCCGGGGGFCLGGGGGEVECGRHLGGGYALRGGGRWGGGHGEVEEVVHAGEGGGGGV